MEFRDRLVVNGKNFLIYNLNIANYKYDNWHLVNFKKKLCYNVLLIFF
jgi:hypothetical protein